MINKKDEEIKKLKEENLKLKDYVEQNKADIEKVNIEKNKEKEIQNLKDEIGVINIIDVNKLLNISKKFSSDILKIQNIKHCYIGNTNSANNNNNVQDNEVNNDKNEINNDKNETNKKKKKKKSIIKIVYYPDFDLIASPRSPTLHIIVYQKKKILKKIVILL